MSAHLLPGVLAELVGGQRRIDVPAGSVGGVLDALAGPHPGLVRRLRDETGALRRHVNVYVNGEDVRGADGLRTMVPEGGTVQVLPPVAGGCETMPG